MIATLNNWKAQIFSQEWPLWGLQESMLQNFFAPAWQCLTVPLSYDNVLKLDLDNSVHGEF